MCVRTKGMNLFTAHPLNGKVPDRLRQPFVPTWGFAGRLTDSAAMCRGGAVGPGAQGNFVHRTAPPWISSP